MISRIRNSALIRVLWGLMGIYLLNISVDTADPKPEYIPENLSFNDQESVLEVLFEKLLGFEDIIREYDDHDPGGHTSQANVKIDLVVLFPDTSTIFRSMLKAGAPTFPEFPVHLARGFHQPDTPPPKI